MQKIVSLVPSQTELLYHLGLDEEVAGITKFCVHPPAWLKTKTSVGGTKNINIEKIISLQPDLIIANKEENVKEQIEALQEFANVYVSDISNFEDAIKMILEAGSLVNKKEQAALLTEEIKTRFDALQKINKTKIPAAYFIWRNPYMAAGGDTFINDMMKAGGFENVLSDRLRYPVVDLTELNAVNCKVLLLSSEPFPFKQKHINELQPYLPGTKIVLVDGEMFSWYGSRLLYAPDYFKQLRNIFTKNYFF